MSVEITEWMPDANGGRRRSFTVDGIRVVVESAHKDEDEAARKLALVLSDTTPLLARLNARIERQEHEIVALKMQVPPKEPARLLAPGCVRMRDGVVWLLGQRVKGWASFGLRLDGWDDLFRRYSVIVTGHGIDEHGPYWTVENARNTQGV